MQHGVSRKADGFINIKIGVEIELVKVKTPDI
jgi:hypothetical protein